MPCITTTAQINRTRPVPWQAKLSTAGSLLDGNVARFLLINRLELTYSDSAWGISTRNDYQYGTTRHAKSEDDFVSYNFLYLAPAKPIYPYLMNIVETNYRRQIRVRYQLGSGVSYKAWTKGSDFVRLSVSATYEVTHFRGAEFENHPDTTSSTIDTWRVTGRLFGIQSLFASKLKLSYEFWWQQSISDGQNFRVYHEESLEIPLSKQINFKTGFRYSYEHVRIVGLRGFDLFWTFGLSLNFFFDPQSTNKTINK